jgi:hypothetical protein
VVAIGIGAAGLTLHSGVIAAAVLGLALVACLWWAYFAGDTERAEHALQTAAPDRRPWLALEGFFYAHVPVLVGVISIAAGVSSAIGHPSEPLATGPAAALAVGAFLYLAGDVAFRRRLDLGGWIPRATAAVMALATIPLGRSSAALDLRPADGEQRLQFALLLPYYARPPRSSIVPARVPSWSQPCCPATWYSNASRSGGSSRGSTKGAAAHHAPVARRSTATLVC